MSVKDSIRRARENSISDVDIIEEVKKQNPQAASYFKRKEYLGWSPTQVLDDLGSDVNASKRSLFSKKSIFLLIVSTIFLLSYVVFLSLRDTGYVANQEKVLFTAEVEDNSELVAEDKELRAGEIEIKEDNIEKEVLEEQLMVSEEITPFLSEESFHLPILMYHHVSNLPSHASDEWRDLNVSPVNFEKQMEYLYKEGYQTINFTDLAVLIEDGGGANEKYIIITFDDGWLNQYQNAFPILKKYGFKATFYVVGRYINGSSFISKEQIKEMIDEGMEVGSHTMSHPNLNQITEDLLNYEVVESKSYLEDTFTVDVVSFAYPYGAYSDRVVNVVSESGYRFARSVVPGIDQNINRLYNLKTIRVFDEVENFKRLISR